ncbi:MAG: hypothetical protein RL689_1527 [Planctomycetota bacterium]
MSSTEAQRPARAESASAEAAAEAASHGEDSQFQSLLDSVDRTAAAAEASLEEARAIAAEDLAEKVQAGTQTAAAPDLASQLDSLLENVDPAKASDPPAPTATDPAAAATTEPADTQDLAGQLDALLEQAEGTNPAEQPAEAKADDATADQAAAAVETPATKTADETPAGTDDIAAALDALDGGGATPSKAEPDAEHMTEEAAATSARDATATKAAAASPEPTRAAAAPAPATGAMVAPNATPTSPAEMTKVDADPSVMPPGPAAMLRVPSEELAAATPVAGPSFTRRVGTALMKPVEKFHAGANAAEAVTLRALSPLGRPMATASRGVRLAVGGFALYSAALGLGAAYYAVFVRPTTFYQTRATPFSLKEGALPSLPHGEAEGHGTDAAHGKTDKKEAAGHGDDKSKSSSKQPPKKKEAEKKSTAKKGADKKGSDKKTQGGH